MAARRFRLGEILVGERLATLQEVADALCAQVIEGGRLGTVLVQQEIVRLDDLGRCLALQHGVPHADEVSLRSITAETLAIVPTAICQRHLVLPLRVEAGALHLAMLDPVQTVADVVSFTLGMPVQPCVAPELRLLYYLERFCGLEREPRYLRSLPEGPPQSRRSEALDRRKHVRATIAPAVSALEPPPERKTLPFGVTPGGAQKADSAVERVVSRLEIAITGAAIAELLVEPVLDNTATSILFWVRGSGAVGCCARGTRVPDMDVRKMVVSLSDPSLLQWAISAQGAVRADAGSDSIEGELARMLGSPDPGEICVAPVILNERVVNLIVIYAKPDQKFQSAGLDEIRVLCEHAASAYRRVGERLKRGSRAG